LPPTEPRLRCLGLELGGGKSSRTAVVVLDYYPSEQKIFIVDAQAQVQGNRHDTGDEILLETLHKYQAQTILVNAPLTLPPCFDCTLPVCPTYRHCEVAQVAWMRDEGERLKLSGLKAPTPYTQRPIDVAMRGLLQQGLAVDFPVDETLGAGPAPLVARIRYLARHLKNVDLLEVNPRLVMARLGEWYDISARHLKRYRDIGEGLEQRVQMLHAIGRGAEEKIPQLFIYQEDTDALCREIAVFDAFICALMGVFRAAGLADQPLPGFLPAWGTTLLPRRRLRPVQSRARMEFDQES
jgi:hypothetical protein